MLTTTTTTAQLTASLAANMGEPSLTAGEILQRVQRSIARGETVTPRERLLITALEIQTVRDARMAAAAPEHWLYVDARAIVTRRSGYYRPGSARTRSRWAAADPRGTRVALSNLRDSLV